MKGAAKETVIWGTKAGAEDWESQILYGGKRYLTDEEVERVLAHAAEAGFGRFRVETFFFYRGTFEGRKTVDGLSSAECATVPSVEP